MKRLSSVLDHSELNDYCAYDNDQEEFVIEEIFENVVFISFQLTSVDFVEYLKENENVEEDGVVFSCLVVPIADSDRTGNAENIGT